MNFFLEILYVVLYRYSFFFRFRRLSDSDTGDIFYIDDLIMSITIYKHAFFCAGYL